MRALIAIVLVAFLEGCASASGLSPGMQANATQVARILAEGQSRPTRVALTSPRDAVAIALLSDAIDQLDGKQLSQLELAFIGNPEVRGEVSALIAKSGGRLIFVEH